MVTARDCGRIRTSVAMTLLLASSQLLAQDAKAAIIKFNIEPQPLARALNTWAEQAGLQIIWPVGDPVAYQSSPAVRGQLEPLQALRVLLDDTDLTYSVLGGGETVAIHGSTGLRRGNEAVAVAPLHLAEVRTDAIAPADVSAQPARGASDTGVRVALQSRGAELEEIVVIGTHIRGVPPDSSPTTVYTRKDIELSGAGTVAEFIRKIPQNFSSVDAGTTQVPDNADVSSNALYHASGINLRGLGAGATLVLLNGHRLAPSGSDGSFVDVSMIPLSAVERIEVLADGASAIYGSDAVAGVVNFVLRSDFDGAETSLRYGNTTSGGAEERRVSQLFGRAWSSGNAMLAFEMRDQGPLRGDQRDYVPNVGVNGDEGLRYLIPDEKHQNLLLTLRQKLAPSIDMFADAIYGDRDFVIDTSTGALASRDEGGSKQYGGVLGFGYDFANSWRAELIGNYSKIDQSTRNELTVFIPEPDTSVSRPKTRSKLFSVDLNLDGPVFRTRAGAVRTSFGLSVRSEEFEAGDVTTLTSSHFSRDVKSAYGEAFVPLIGPDNSVRFVSRLELSLAARYENYEDVGSSTDPKVGLLWSPVRGLNFRASYAESFRAPVLSQLSDIDRFYFAFPLEDPSINGSTNTLILSSSGNAALLPERSKSLAIGIDVEPPDVPGLSLAATYFEIEYSRRIATPPVQGGNFFLIFLQESALSPFIDRAPDPAELQRIFTQENNLINPFGLVPADIGAIYDGRLHNIGETTDSGFDLQTNYHVDAGVGALDLFLSGTYLIDIKNKAAPTTDTVQFVNSIYHPMDLRLRAGATWAVGNFSLSLSGNYFGDYKDDRLIPAGRVGSWATADLVVGYDTQDNFVQTMMRNMKFSLSVQNLSDRDPPRVPQITEGSFDLGYDPANASPLGRFISLTVDKRW